MPVKPITPKKNLPLRSIRPGVPVVTVQKSASGSSGGWMMLLLVLAALAIGYSFYNNQQKNEAALSARQQRLEENAKVVAEAERQRAEYEKGNQQKESGSTSTAPGTAATTAADTADFSDEEADTHESSVADDFSSDASFGEEKKDGTESALGSTEITEGSGEFAEQDTSAPAFELATTGAAADSVMNKLDKAIDDAGNGDTFHDLQADLKRSFELAYPGLFADASSIPPFPDKSEKLLRLAQGVYVCLNLAAELDARDTVPADNHAKFVNWLMKEKAKAARIFVFGLEREGINDFATAAERLDNLRDVYLKSPSSALKKIPSIIKDK